MTVAALALVVTLYYAVDSPIPLVVKAGRIFSFLTISFLAVRLAQERERAVQHAREEAARQTERRERTRLAAVLRQMPSGVIIAEAPSGRVTFANEQVGRLWPEFAAGLGGEDYPRHQEPARNGAKAPALNGATGLHADGRAYAPEEWPLARALATGEIVVDEEIRFPRGDGSLGTLSASAAPIRDERGRVVDAVMVLTDVSERRRAEEERARLLADLQSANEQLVQSESELAKLAEQLQSQNEELQTQSEELQSQAEELRALSEELLAQNEELQSQDAELRRLAEEAREQRERAERAAEEAGRRAAQLQATIDSMVDGVLAYDAEGRVILANGLARDLLGMVGPAEPPVQMGEVSQRARLRHLDGRPVLPEETASARALAGETVTALDQIGHNWRRDRDVYVRTSAAPIRDDKGRITGAVVVVRDVTELTELERLKDQFIAVAAHELKTPVTIMKGYAEALLRSGQPSPPQRKMLDAIDRGADRIGRIINDLLDISKLQTGSLALHGERIDLPQLVEEQVDRMELTAARHRVQLARAQPVVIQGDRERLEQVVASLLDNAVKYSPEGGYVEVAVAVAGGEAIVSVHDQGVGIPAEKQARIFERFYRAHTHTPHDYGGMGVGLYIANEIVKRHGGRMWFESEEGRGSTFSFSLPLAQAAVSQ